MNVDRLGPIVKTTVSILIIISFFGTIATLFLLSYFKVQLEMGVKEVLLVLVGVLAGAFKDVCGYWLGSSASSARKTEINASLLGKADEPTV
jgi:membrane protein DedA with SNARE-associated domain